MRARLATIARTDRFTVSGRLWTPIAIDGSLANRRHGGGVTLIVSARLADPAIGGRSGRGRRHTGCDQIVGGRTVRAPYTRSWAAATRGLVGPRRGDLG